MSKVEKKYVAYYRVSTKMQGESGLGIESQKAIVDHFTHDGEVIESFTEVGSGKSRENRPELDKAMRLCIENGYTLIVAKADRLSRNVVDALSIYDRLNENMVCCDCPSTDRFTLTIIFAVAERERELISIRTKAALKAKKARDGKKAAAGRNAHKNKDTEEYKERTKKAVKVAHKANTEKARLRNRSYANYAVMRLDEEKTLKQVANELNRMEQEKKDADWNYKPRNFTPSSVHRLIKYSDAEWNKSE